MINHQYSEEFKKNAAKKLLSRGSQSIRLIVKETGVSAISLRAWVKKYGTHSIVKKEEKRPQDWSLDQKLDAVFKYEKLDEESRGEYLRSNGLHSDFLSEWKNDIQRCFTKRDHEGSSFRTERLNLQKQIRDLQTDLTRKEKALAETAALLILKKKADLIWGTEVRE